MAERRMFAKSIIDSDVFLDMPASSQNLYFHLGMRADDEGFVNAPKKIMRMIGANQNDMEILLSKRYLIGFDSGVIVIKHWKLHNTLRKDRLKPTDYQEEKSMLSEKENGAYTDSQPSDNQVTTKSLPDVGVEECIIIESNVEEKKDIYSDTRREIIEYLNNFCDMNYRHNSGNAKKYIDARLKEGFTINDFKKVVIKKCNEWRNTDMQKYIRPETLFGTKFESYLNQPIGKTESQPEAYVPKTAEEEYNEMAARLL